jgi:uncharacterized tellurite resistance protein B-like protein
MFNLIKQLFESPESPESTETHDDRLRVATCVVLLEAARADDEFSAEERIHVVDTLKKRFTLSEPDANELIDAATNRRAESNDLWSFTNQINQALKTAEKIEIIEEVWRVIFADGGLDAHEDALIHKLSRLLNIHHQELIEAKMRVRSEQV